MQNIEWNTEVVIQRLDTELKATLSYKAHCVHLCVICAVTQGRLVDGATMYNFQALHRVSNMPFRASAMHICVFVVVYLYLCLCVLAESMTGVLLVRWPNKPFRASAKHRAITLHLRSPRLR